MQTFEEFKKELDDMVNGAQETDCTETESYDPVAEMRKECDAMREALNEKEAELEKANIMREQAEKTVEKLALNLQNSMAATEQFKANAADMGKALKREREGREQDRKAYEVNIEVIRKYVIKPLRLPLILGISAGILALLVGVCIDRNLMTCVLGDPLGAGLMAACALFAGVCYERLRLR